MNRLAYDMQVRSTGTNTNVMGAAVLRKEYGVLNMKMRVGIGMYDVRRTGEILILCTST